MDFVAIIAALFVLPGGILGIRRFLRAEHQGWLLAAIFALLFGLLLTRFPEIQTTAPLTFTLEWMPRLGLALSLYVDGLALLFALIITGIAATVFFYAGYYFDDQYQSGWFFALLLIFTGSMLLLVLAGNLLTLFIAWELTSVISFLLISFKGKDAEARRGASQALVITGGGGLALLVGLLLAGTISGSLEFTTLLSNGEVLRAHPLYSAITVLILLGCFTKSAQFPLHFWLPEAMSAPTPASAFLHSATMVKAGIYLLLRFQPVLGETVLWNTSLTVIGLTTLLVGAFLALGQLDLKGMLAFSTISQLGALVALIGQPDYNAIKAALVGVVAHALYKCTLFLVVGAVDHATGTRNINELGGLHHRMRGFAVVTFIATLSMAGVPPLLGFVSKELLLEGFIGQPVALIILVLSALLTVTLALRLFVDVFLGKPHIEYPQTEHTDHDEHHPLGDDAYDYSHFHTVPRLMVVGPTLLAAFSVGFGFGVVPLLEPIVETVMRRDIALYLLPPSINLAFVLSMMALVLGGLIFLLRHYWLAWKLPRLLSGPQIYRGVIRGIERIADLLLKFQGGKIRYYLMVILGSVVLMLVQVVNNADLIDTGKLQITVTSINDVLKAVLLFLSLGATFASVLFSRHLLAALSLGLAGYAIGGIFLLEPAPDVALVQFLIETLATVLIIVILSRTSEEERLKAMSRLWKQTPQGLGRDIGLSVALGILVTIFALAAVSTRPTPNPISDWYLNNTYNELSVNDVVAGIITDFRGTDTLIEITVFGTTALGILTLLARPKPGRTMKWFGSKQRQTEVNGIKDAVQEDAERPETLVYRSHFNDSITRVVALPLLPLSMMIALAHILYAGAGPGDGFTAGVICGLGITLWFVVFGYEEVKRRLHWLHPSTFIGMGLLIAFINALLPLFFGREFMAFTELSGIRVDDIKLASSLVFEVGICFTVFGAINAILEAITHPKEVEPV